MVVNPIIHMSEYQNDFFVRIPLVEPGIDKLLLSPSGGVCWVTESTTPSSIRKGRYDQMVSVATQPGTIYVCHRSGSANEDYVFDLELKIRAWVVDPVEVYRNQITDIEKTVFKEIRHDLDHIARQYKPEKRAVFESAIVDQLGRESQAQGLAFRVLSANASIVLKKPSENNEQADDSIVQNVSDRIEDLTISGDSVRQDHSKEDA